MITETKHRNSPGSFVDWKFGTVTLAPAVNVTLPLLATEPTFLTVPAATGRTEYHRVRNTGCINHNHIRLLAFKQPSSCCVHTRTYLRASVDLMSHVVPTRARTHLRPKGQRQIILCMKKREFLFTIPLERAILQ